MLLSHWLQSEVTTKLVRVAVSKYAIFDAGPKQAPEMTGGQAPQPPIEAGAGAPPPPTAWGQAPPPLYQTSQPPAPVHMQTGYAPPMVSMPPEG